MNTKEEHYLKLLLFFCITILSLTILGMANEASGADCSTFNPTDEDWCKTCGPCPEGQGDCDGNIECQDGLVCTPDVGEKYGLRADFDVCEDLSAGETKKRIGAEYETDKDTITVAWGPNDPAEGVEGYQVKLIMTDKDPHTDYARGETAQTQMTIKRPRSGHFDGAVRAFKSCIQDIENCENGRLYSDWTVSTDKESSTVDGQPMAWWIYWKLPKPGVIIE